MFIIKFILFGIISKSFCSDVDIVKTLKDRYNDASTNCMDSKNRTRPAYECSGLILRGVKFDETDMKYPWSKKNQTIIPMHFHMHFYV